MLSTPVIIYGFHAVFNCLAQQPERIEFIAVDQQRNDQRMQKLLHLAAQKNINIQKHTRGDLDKMAEVTHHQGVLASLKSHEHSEDLEEFLEGIRSPFLLILDGIQDPHNLGACLRTANAAGVTAVIAPKDKAANITPVVAKVASGAASFTPFFQVTNLARTLKMLKSRGIWLYGTSEHASQLYNEVSYSGPTALVMGSEGKGLRRLTEENCDFLIRIPMFGSVSSLNVSVATGICLFEVVRQQYDQP